jgi:hypothetical protein
MKEEIFLVIFIVCMILGAILLIYAITKHFKEKKERINRILTETKPIEIRFHDLLIYEYSNGEDTIRAFCPVLKDINSNKLYIRKPNEDLGKISITWHIIYKETPIEIKSKTGKKIDSNIKGYLYIDKQEQLQINKNKINLLSSEFEYKGNMKEMKTFNSLNDIYSMTSENILEELKDAYVFEGIIDFDIDAPINL